MLIHEVNARGAASLGADFERTVDVRELAAGSGLSIISTGNYNVPIVRRVTGRIDRLLSGALYRSSAATAAVIKLEELCGGGMDTLYLLKL